MFSQEGERIDSVNVAVPDHMHFAIAYSAIQKGKHVYCQKPLCHEVAEVRALTRAAVQRGVITQLGNPGFFHSPRADSSHLVTRRPESVKSLMVIYVPIGQARSRLTA
jgi:predicted dehydrogenase